MSGGSGAARVALPRLTFAVFLAIATCFWLNAIINHYRFNVVLAVLGSLPLLVLSARAVLLARAAR